jgi:chromosomal replication initiation ATPase DnaA
MSPSKKKEIWKEIIASLGSKLPKKEFQTWFSRTSLKKLDDNMAIIDVPNKFVATWMSDNYLIELKKIIKKLTKTSPASILPLRACPALQTNLHAFAALPSEDCSQAET